MERCICTVHIKAVVGKIAGIVTFFIKAITENMFEKSSNLHTQALALQKMLFSFQNSFSLFYADRKF